MSSKQTLGFFPKNLIQVIEKNSSLLNINKSIYESTGIIDFFQTENDIDKFKDHIKALKVVKTPIKDFGDFQTPSSLTDQICSFLYHSGINPYVIIEPTCGEGNFVISSLKFFSNLKYVIAIDIQPSYEWKFKENIAKFQFNLIQKPKINFFNSDIFTHDLSQLLNNKTSLKEKSILIIGNPPWVTNTKLSKLESSNVPKKKNISSLKGLDAITGKANFDISESIILRLITNAPKKSNFAFLCKMTVARNLIKNLDIYNIKLEDNKFFLIDTLKEFDVNTNAGLFTFKSGSKKEKLCKVYSFYQPNTILYKFGYIKTKFISNLDLYNRYGLIDGVSTFIWRQGIKHDATKIFVLKRTDLGDLINGLQEKISIEDELLYPLIKSSQLNNRFTESTNKFLIVTQLFVGQDTKELRNIYPNAWNYLSNHNNLLKKRKSVIYRNKPDFAIFGVGKYTFKPFKIAISGFNKRIIFSFIPPINKKPVMLDDTCYYLSFEDETQCLIVWGLLNSKIVSNFLSSIIFIDSKRPYTKELLMRINFRKLVQKIDYDKFMRIYSELKSYYDIKIISKQEYDSFIDFIIKTESKT